MSVRNLKDGNKKPWLCECYPQGRTGKRIRKRFATKGEAAAFEKAMTNWNASLKTQCAKMGIGLTQTTTNVPFDQVIQAILHRGGLVA